MLVPLLSWIARRAAGGFDPLGADLEALYTAGPAWCFTDAGVTPAGNGDAVHTWLDRSGNAWHIAQTNASLRPTLRDDGGGLWSVEFDGSDMMTNGAATLAQPLTIYARVRSHTGGGYMLYTGGAVALGYHVALGNDYALYAGSSGCAVQQDRIGATPGTFAGVLNGASSVLRLDGVQIAAGNAGSNTISGGWNVGAFDSASGQLTGKIAALGVYSGAHSGSTLTGAEAYFTGL